jgi:hypothetical protein
MSFSGKWMELEIMMLGEISQVQNPSIASFCSFVESRPNDDNGT